MDDTKTKTKTSNAHEIPAEMKAEIRAEICVHQITPVWNNTLNSATDSALRLAQQLHELGVNTTTHGIKSGDQSSFPMHNYPSQPFNRLGHSIQMNNALKQASQSADIFHAHENWRMALAYAERACRNSHTKLVLSPHGTFAPWALRNNRLSKTMARKFLFDRLWRSADLIHVTSEREYEDVRRAGLRNPIAIIPLGIDLPEFEPNLGLLSIGDEKILLHLGRIAPVKRISQLLDAWRVLEPKFDDWQLVIAGPLDSAYAQQMIAKCAENRLQRVHFPGLVDEEKKCTLFSLSSVFVLISESENFGLAVGEALGYGCPVLTSESMPWGEVVNRKCGWCIEHAEEQLISTLDEVMSMDACSLSAMGDKGSHWIRESFSWKSTAQKMYSAYSWLIGRTSKPEWVHM